MQKLLIWIITIFCPGLIFLLEEKYFYMLVAFALQISMLGWIPAIIWARHAWKKQPKKLLLEPEKTDTTTQKSGK